jgi:glutamyl-tRNA synthetase
MDQSAWDAIRPNLETVTQVADWWSVVEGPIARPDMSDEDRAYLAEAAAAAESLDWSADPWHALTAALKEKTGRKGKLLFLPLRQALTGRDHGPDMAALLPLIGKTRSLERLG